MPWSALRTETQMERTNSQSSAFAICGRCPLDKKLQGQDRAYRDAAGETVRHIIEEIESMDGVAPLYGGDTPAFAQEASQVYGTEELTEQAWYCSRIRQLGTCASVQVVFPDPKYL